MFIAVRNLLLSFLIFTFVLAGPEENEGVKYANKCEGELIIH